ncbi:MAG: hypothetical protein K2O54_06885 [Prevotella sp.]|nr:hypothetical protein [Prevotella sp.]
MNNVLDVPYPENLLSEIFEGQDLESALHAPDVAASLNYVIDILDSPYPEILRARYKDHNTLQAIATERGRTKERIRQQLNIALHKLKHPARRVFLIHGIAGYTAELATRLMMFHLSVDTPIEKMDLSVRSINCIRRGDLKTIGDVLDAIEHDELRGIRNLGKISYDEIVYKLRESGFVVNEPVLE